MKCAIWPLLSCCIMIGCSSPSPPSFPAVKEFTQPEQAEIAKEHNQLPAGSILRGVLQDWERMRRELRGKQ